MTVWHNACLVHQEGDVSLPLDAGRGVRGGGGSSRDRNGTIFLKGEKVTMSIQKQKRPKSDIMLEPGAWAVIQTAVVTQTITVITKDNDSLTAEINGGAIFSPTCEQRIYRGSIVQVFQVNEFAGNRYYGFRDIHGQEFSHYIPKKDELRNNPYLMYQNGEEEYFLINDSIPFAKE